MGNWALNRHLLKLSLPLSLSLYRAYGTSSGQVSACIVRSAWADGKAVASLEGRPGTIRVRVE